MIHVFNDEQAGSETRDTELVALAQEGDRAALEELLLRHQAWIYNIALRMVGRPSDAEDVTQEILIKVITRLSSFQGKSKFRTWLYRIVVNHAINMKKRGMEYVFSSFERHNEIRGNAPDQNLPDTKSLGADTKLLMEETKIRCMNGMLLCLDRTQRLVFILGAVFGVRSELGADILEISPANFRQKLSRARKELTNYMDGQCGLMNPENPCRCARKTRAAIEAGYIDPHDVRYRSAHLQRVNAVVSDDTQTVDEALNIRAQNLFQDQPFRESPDYAQMLKELLDRKEFQELIQFN